MFCFFCFWFSLLIVVAYALCLHLRDRLFCCAMFIVIAIAVNIIVMLVAVVNVLVCAAATCHLHTDMLNIASCTLHVLHAKAMRYFHHLHCNTVGICNLRCHRCVANRVRLDLPTLLFQTYSFLLPATRVWLKLNNLLQQVYLLHQLT